MSYATARRACRDRWFLFDVVLVLLMIVEMLCSRNLSGGGVQQTPQHVCVCVNRPHCIGISFELHRAEIVAGRWYMSAFGYVNHGGSFRFATKNKVAPHQVSKRKYSWCERATCCCIMLRSMSASALFDEAFVQHLRSPRAPRFFGPSRGSRKGAVEKTTLAPSGCPSLLHHVLGARFVSSVQTVRGQ